MAAEGHSLRLVYSRDQDRLGIRTAVQPFEAQATLFPCQKKRLLLFVSISRVKDFEFKELLEVSQPGTILELRAFPRFDIGRMNRHVAFEWFRSVGSRYIEVGDRMKGSNRKKGEPFHNIQPLLAKLTTEEERPIMFLLNGSLEHLELAQSLAQALPRECASTWDVYQFPRS